MRQETAWGHYVIGDAIPGLTAAVWSRIISGIWAICAGRAWASALCMRVTEAEPANMAWVSQYSNANLVKTDFFEAKSTAYAKSTALVDDL